MECFCLLIRRQQSHISGGAAAVGSNLILARMFPCRSILKREQGVGAVIVPCFRTAQRLQYWLKNSMTC
jgi:hypothetical protein